MARKHTSIDPLLGAARADGDGVAASVVPPVAPLTPDAVPALVAEMVQAVVAVAAAPEPVAAVSAPADLPTVDAHACAWERGRTAENVQVYRCALCGAERRR